MKKADQTHGQGYALHCKTQGTTGMLALSWKSQLTELWPSAVSKGLCTATASHLPWL